MGEQSAGILAYRHVGAEVEVLLVHPGGPFWAKKDAGAWSIPKGLLQQGEDPLAAARREFAEETGFLPEGRFLPLGSSRQPSGKTIHVWALAADFDVAQLRSNVFTTEWPPRSGSQHEFPEVDKGGWFALATASEKILKGQRVFLERVRGALGEPPGSRETGSWRG